ncbi:MAG: O-antigen ligase family protein [Ktedonobacteraceae bacterium]|nr:polysaccharide biosynthesis C-terminal domain-containing protein [Chloroflexota bacterium]
MKNIAQVPRRWETIRELISPPVIFSILAALATLPIGVVIGALSPVYGAVITGIIIIVIIVLLRLNEFAVTLIVALHILVDSYFGLDVYQIAMLVALVLLFACYFGRSVDHPWTGPRSLGFWVLFLLLTIYPTINGGAFRLTNAIAYYLNLVLSAFVMFWLGNIIAKDIAAVRRVFQLLSILAALIAIHTIIQATTGKFLFETARAEAMLAQYSNFPIVGAGISRAGSFFGGPNGNAAFLVTSFFLPFGLFIESKLLWTKLIYLLEMLLILLALIFTYSTGGWIATLAGTLVLVFLVGRLRHCVLLLTLIASLAVILFTVFPSQIAVQLSHASEQGDLALHVGGWQTAVRVIEAFPLFGVGLGDQAYLVHAEAFRVPAQIVPLQEPDNSYLQWGAIAGIPVMLVFLLLLGRTFWFAWRNWLSLPTSYRPLLGGGIVALIALSVISLSVDGWTGAAGQAYLGWLIAGIVASPLLGRCLTQQTTPAVARTAETAISRPGYLEWTKRSRVHDMREYGLGVTVKPIIPRPKVAGSQASLPVTHTADSENYLGLLRNFVKSSGIYAISSLASPLVSLLLLPFLAHVLSHSDYGALAVLDTVIALAASVTSLGLDAVFARVYSYECKTPREQLDALSTLALLLFLILVPVVFIGVIAAPWLSVLVLGNASYASAIVLAVLLVLLQNLTRPGLMWMRVESRATPYTIMAIANFLLVAGASIVLVGMLHMGIVGALMAVGLGNLIVVVSTLPLIFWHAGFRLRFAMMVSMITLGVPYAMNYITLWVLQLSDRYLLVHFASLSAAANYAVAYSLGMGAGFVVTQPFAMAWWVLIYPIARRDDAPHVFKLIFRGYGFVLLFATLGLALFGTSVLDLLFPAAYHGQSLIISVVALSNVFNSIFVVFNLGMTLRRKTWLAFIALLFSALLNVGVNIVLIPLYGAMGAAMATLVAYIALALVSYLFNQRIYPVPFEVGLFLFVLGLGIGLYLVDSRLAQGQSDVIVWGMHIGLLLLYGGTLTALGLFPSRRKKEMRVEEDFA